MICKNINAECTEIVPRCNDVDDGYYIPMLHQGDLQKEIEDGYRPDGSSTRIGFSDAVFPGYRWRGYARYSPVQNEVILPVKIKVQSLYRIIYRYMVILSRFTPNCVAALISSFVNFRTQTPHRSWAKSR